MFRCASLITLLGITGLAVAEPLTFDVALELATRSSPDIAVQTASVEAARSAATAAGRLPDPKLTFGVENFPVTGDERGSLTRDFMTMREVGVMQDVPNSGKRQARVAAATADAERAQAQRRVSILTVRRDSALAWLNRYYLERRGALLDELDRENQLFAQLVEAQLAGGRGMPADAVAPKQEAAELADRRDELASAIATSKATLARWTGLAADEPLAGDPPALTFDPTQLRGHIHEHPELAVFAPMTQMAQAEVHEAEAAKRPDWGVELSYGRRGSAFSDMVSLQFTLDLPLFPRTRQDPQIQAKRLELNRVESERDAMLRDHTQELDAELAEYEVTTRQLARVREAHLPLAQQKVDYQLTSYRAGKGDLTTVLNARREQIEERLKEIELEGRRAATIAKLYFFYGPGASDIKADSTREGAR
jgi:outer membrane protein, heavy metal efflux system